MRTFKLFLVILVSLYVTDKIVYFGLRFLERDVLTGEGIGKINHFLRVKDTTQLVFFGNSRANHHIDPQIFGRSSYNIGVGGRKMAFSATLIHTLPPNMSQYVFLQIDPSYVFDTLYDGSDIKALMVKYHQQPVIKQHIQKLEQHTLFSSVFWSLDYNGKVFSILMNRFRPKYDYRKYFGYDPMVNSKAQQEIFKKRLTLLEPKSCSNEYKASDLELYYLESIRQFCQKNQKKLLLFTSPVYRDACTKDNIAMQQLMDSLGIAYQDFSTIPELNTQLEYWKDESHLSQKGAAFFSTYLKEQLDKQSYFSQ